MRVKGNGWDKYFEDYENFNSADGSWIGLGYTNIPLEQIHDLDFTPSAIIAIFNDQTVVFELPEVVIPT